jgi:hypothetical protein
MGLKQKRGTIVLEALEIKYIRYAVLSLPTHTTKKSRSFLKYFRKQSAQQPEMVDTLEFTSTTVTNVHAA